MCNPVKRISEEINEHGFESVLDTYDGSLQSAFKTKDDYFSTNVDYVMNLISLEAGIYSKEEGNESMTIPSSYFSEFPSKQIELIKGLDKSGLINLPEEFGVPDGYFGQMPELVMSSIQKKASLKSTGKVVQFLKTWYSVAAAVIIIVAFSWWYHINLIQAQNDWAKDLTDEELYEYIVLNESDYSLENLAEELPNIQDLIEPSAGAMDDLLDELEEEDLNL
ncbi:MAG: hypothetical protein IPM48_01240 [Saprospiraceae bacterium]|nr:hypothetical protein [Saprospiraceae bacterium]